jgi:RHS repeat-associated protein
MRHHPSCWNKVLAKLGFRRVSRGHKRQAAFAGRLSRIESLESRQMLTAVNYTLTTLEDVEVAGTTTDNLWSLREALAHSAADAGVGEDIIQFAGLSGVIDLNPALGQLPVNRHVKIVGPGADKLTIDARDASRVFSISSGAVATISGLTITGGSVTASSPGGNLGGGILNQGNLELSGVVVVGNQTDYTNLSGGNGGGGIYSVGGDLRLVNSTIDGNRSRYGGGVSVSVNAGKLLEIAGSTISNNFALSSSNDGAGGGVYLSGASTASLSIVNATFSGNRSKNGAALYVGSATTALTVVNATIADNHTKDAAGSYISGGLAAGINNNIAGTVTLHNTILADNVASNPAWHNGIGTLAGTGSSHNLVDIGYSAILMDPNTGTTGNRIGSGSRLPTLLAPLGDYGGPTKTHALKVGSLALNVGSNSWAPPSDQRGEQRLDAITGTSDIGAFEAGDFTVLTVRSDDDRNDSVDLKATVDSLRLREALALATSLAGTETIRIEPSGWADSKIRLSLEQLSIASGVKIVGPGADKLTIDARDASRVFSISSGAVATISGLTITGGSVTASSPGGNLGGGILNQGNLELSGVVVVGNQTDYTNLSGGNGGGGIYSVGGDLRLVNSTIDGNRSRYGGGVSVSVNAGKLLEIAGSTISNNFALSSSNDGAGGGVYLSGASTASLSIVNATFSGNRSKNGAALYVGSATTALTVVNATIADNHTKDAAGSYISGGLAAGINNNIAGTVTLHNTILADNVASNPAWHNGIGTLAGTGSSHNLVDIGYSAILMDPNTGTTGNRIGSGSRLPTLLAPLGDYGGPTKTHALKVGSPAIDKGSNHYAETFAGLTTDQRGFSRKVDVAGVDNATAGWVDIGAFESSNGAPESSTHVAQGDFNGDSRTDDLLFDPLTGNVSVRLNLGGSAELQPWGSLAPTSDAVSWANFTVGDFTGDGRADFLVRNAFDDKWTLAISESNVFHTIALDVSGDWTQRYVGDFDGDGAKELLGRATPTSSWKVLDYDGQRGVSVKDWGPSLLGTTTIYVGDVDRDGRDDLVGGSVNSWIVSIASVAGAFSPNQNYGQWFNGHLNGGVLDVDGPYRAIVNAFAKVHNSVNLDFYFGIKKGPQATLETRSASPWDQAAALVRELADPRFSAEIVSGRVKVPLPTVRAWIGASPTASLNAVKTLLGPLSYGAVTDEVSEESALVIFDHAWVRATVPTAAGLTTIDLDPSWKFRSFSSGISLSDINDLNDSDSFNRGLFDEFKYLDSTVIQDGTSFRILPDTPLEFFEGELQRWLTANDPGLSLADVAYNGPLQNYVTEDLPPAPWTYGVGGNVQSSVGQGTLECIAANLAKRQAYMHRFRVSMLGIGFDETTEQFIYDHLFTIGADLSPDHTATFAQHAYQPIIIHNNLSGADRTSEYWGGAGLHGFEDSSYDLNLFIERYEPGQVAHLAANGTYPNATHIVNYNNNSDSIKSKKINVPDNQIVVVAMDGGQFSLAQADIYRHKIMAGDPEDPIGDLAGLAISEYLYNVDRSARQVASLTGAILQPFTGYAILQSSHSLLSVPNLNLSYTPYSMVPEQFAIGETYHRYDARDIATAQTHNEPNQLISWQTIAARHEAIERTTSSHAGSAIRVLQRMYAGQMNVDNYPSVAQRSYIGFFENRLVDVGGLLYPQVLWHRNIVSSFNESDPIAIPRYNPNLPGEEVWISPLPLGSVTATTRSNGAAAIRSWMGSNGYANVGVAFSTLTGIEFSGSQAYFNSAQALVGSFGPVAIGAWTATATLFDSDVGIRGESLIGADVVAFRGGRVNDPVFQAISSLLQPADTGLGFLPTAPASVTSGNVFPQATDIAFPNIGYALDFHRQFNSRSIRDVGLGVGWSHSFSDRIIAAPNNGSSDPNNRDLLWLTSEGLEHRFNYRNGAYVPPPELIGVFGKEAGGTQFVFRSRDGTAIYFSKDGPDNSEQPRTPSARLLKKVDVNGNGVIVSYVAGTSDEIAYIADVNNYERRLEFGYMNSPSSRLIETIKKHTDDGLTAPVGQWAYWYTGTAGYSDGTWYNTFAAGHRLTTVHSPSHPEGAYRYTYYGQASTPQAPVPPSPRVEYHGLLWTETLPNGDARSFTYYPNRRVYTVTDGDGFKTRYSYDLVHGKTVVQDARGNEENYLFNANGLITRQIHSDRSRVETQWGVPGVANTDFLKVRTQDEVGATEHFTYYGVADGFKNRELKRSISKQFLTQNGSLVSGQEPGVVTEYDYSRPTGTLVVNLASTIVNPKTTTSDPTRENLKTTFAYDAIGRLLRTTDPLGNVTQFAYDASTGLLKSTTQPKGHFALPGDPAYPAGDYNNPENEAVAWRLLAGERQAGTLLAVTGSTLTVTLSTSEDGDADLDYVVADAIRIDRIDDDGTVVTTIIDNSDVGFQAPGSAVVLAGDHRKYRGTAVTFTKPGSGENTASWSFTGLQPGKYRVLATWAVSAAGVNDSSAEYRIYNGTVTGINGTVTGPLLASLDPSQQVPPNLTGSVYFNSFETVYAYDSAGNVISARTEGLPTSVSTYHHTGALSKVVSASGVVTEHQIDVFGRVIGVQQKGNGATSPILTASRIYTHSGQLKTATDELGRTTSFVYDHRGHVILRTNPDQSTAKFEFGAVGNLLKSVDELGRTTRFFYDGRNRLIQTVYSDGAVEQIRYDGVGRISVITDANRNTTRFEYDAAGRVVKTTTADPDPQKNKATNDYDQLGRLERFVDFRGVTTEFVYDALGRVTQTKTLNKTTPADPPTTLTTIDYDQHGNVRQTAVYDVPGLVEAEISIPADPRSLIAAQVLTGRVQVIRNSYDSFNQLVAKAAVAASADGANNDVVVRSEYNGAGQLRFSVDELKRRTEYVYDAYGRLKQTILPDPNGPLLPQTRPTTTLNYDAAGNVISAVDPNGNVSTFAYDKLNRLVSATDGEGNVVKSHFDAAGQLISAIDALGRATYAAYDSRGRVKTQHAADPDGAGPLTAPATHYEYDDAGNVIAVTAPNGYRTKFQYDQLNRLIKEISTDVQVADNSSMVVVNGDAPVLTSNAEGSFGRDYATVTASSGAPSVAWTFANPSTTSGQQYQVAMTWDGASGLDAAASVQVKIYPPGSGTPNSTVTFTRNQTTDLWLDDGGRWRDWRDLGTFTVPAGGKIELTLIGNAGNPLRVGAVMLQRTIERNFAYDANGNLETETDSLGRTTSYVYDELGRLTKTTLPDPDGPAGNQGPNDSNLQSPVINYKYDGFGNVVQTSEIPGGPEGRITDFKYDKRNRLVDISQSDDYFTERTSKYEYDDAGNLQRVLEAYDSIDEVVTEYDYDALDRLTVEIQDAGRVSSPNPRTATRHRTEYGYDSVGNLIRSELIITDPATQYSPSPVSASTVSTFAYDRANRPVETVSGVGAQSYHPNATTRYAYDAVGNLLTERDATGRVTGYEYDRLNRAIKSTLPDPDLPGQGASAPYATYSYDVLGNVSSVTNSLGESSHRTYDALGRQISAIDAEGNKSRTQYNSENNVVTFTDPSGNVTEYAYDDLNRLKQETIYVSGTPHNRIYTYNDAGLLAQTIDRNGRVKKFWYDAIDRLSLEFWYADAADASPDWIVGYAYDKRDRVTAYGEYDGTFELQHSDEFGYDNLGRITHHSNFEEAVSERPNPRVKQLYQYDVINLSAPASPFQTIYTQAVEDYVGGLFSADAVTTYSMDRLGRTTIIHDHVLNEVNPLINPGKSTKTIDFTYDDAGRMKSIVRSSVGGSFQLNTAFDYDGVGRLKKIDHTRSSVGTIASFDYQYDAASRLSDIDEFFGGSSASVNFNRETDLFYDNAGRLVTRASTRRSGDLNGFVVNDAFTLDESGNRKTTSVDGAAATTNAITPNNRLANDGVYAYEYDNEGNLTTKTQLVNNNPTGEQTLYAWDHRNRLTKVTRYDEPDGDELERVEYRYDANDLRVRREVFASGGSTPATTEHFVNNGAHAAMVLNADGKVQHRYLYGPGTDALLVDEVFNSSGQAERGYWTVADHLGTVHELIESDADGTPADNHKLVEHRDYDASGKLARVITGAAASVALDNLASDFAFAGREWDGDAGLYYNRARWLDAHTGRFISEDPIGFAGGDANLYRYAGGDPANYRDPTGFFSDGSRFTAYHPSLGSLSSEFGGSGSTSGSLSGSLSGSSIGAPGRGNVLASLSSGVAERNAGARDAQLGALANRLGKTLDLAGAGLSADVVNNLSASEAKALEKALGVLDASNVTLAQLQRLGSSAPGLQEAFIRNRRAKDNVYNLLHTAAGQTTLNQVALTAPDAALDPWAVGLRGARTGARALTNGLASAGWSTVTLGFGGPVQLTDVDDFDREYGYDAIAGVTQVVGEIGIGFATGGLAAAAKGGRAVNLASRAAFGFDAAGNAAGVGRGVHNVVQTGEVNWQNGIQIVGGLAGLGGNYGAVVRNADALSNGGSKFANLTSAERQALITQKVQEQALRRIEAQRIANGGSAYGHLPDPKSVGPGKDFTSAQRANIYDANRQMHGGVLRSDLDGSALHVDRPGNRLPSIPNQGGVTPSPFQPAIDHIRPRNPLDPTLPRGTNSYSNAQVLSRTQNGAKSNR